VKGITTDGFEALLKWIYFGEMRISTVAACELVTFCRDYKIPDLQRICVDVLKRSVDIESALTILDLAHLKEGMPDFFVETMKDITPRCVDFILEHFVQMDFKRIRDRKLEPTIAVDVLLALQKKDAGAKTAATSGARTLSVGSATDSPASDKKSKRRDKSAIKEEMAGSEDTKSSDNRNNKPDLPPPPPPPLINEPNEKEELTPPPPPPLTTPGDAAAAADGKELTKTPSGGEWTSVRINPGNEKSNSNRKLLAGNSFLRLAKTTEATELPSVPSSTGTTIPG